MRLVLCDDNRIFCEAFSSMLRANGHPVLAIATTASDSIAAVATNRPDACLLDLRFPDGSGLDVARAIRRSVPETKIVVFSCVTDPAVMAEAKKIGAAGFLRKDQKPGTITAALEVINAGKVAFETGILAPAKLAHESVTGGGPAPEAHAAGKAGAATDRGGPEHWADGPRNERRYEHPAQPHRACSVQAWGA